MEGGNAWAQVSDGGGHEGFVPNTFYPPSEVLVRRIDHLLIPSAVVAVMKLDVEGFGRSTLGSRAGTGWCQRSRHTDTTPRRHTPPPRPCACSNAVLHARKLTCRGCPVGGGWVVLHGPAT
jgi:hypothetical protein